MTAFDKINAALNLNLDEIRLHIEFSKLSARAAAKSGDVLKWAAEDKDIREVFSKFRDVRIVDQNVIYRSLYVQVYANFEWFLRSVVMHFVEVLNGHSLSYAALVDKFGETIVKRNYECSGIAFQQILQNKTNLEIDHHAYAQSLATVIPASPKAIFNSQAFAIFLPALDADGLQKSLKRIGFSDDGVWDRIANAVELQRYYEIREARRLSKRIQEELDDICKKRNQIAHKGDNVPDIGHEELGRLIDFVGLFSKVVSDLLDKEIKQKLRGN